MDKGVGLDNLIIAATVDGGRGFDRAAWDTQVLAKCLIILSWNDVCLGNNSWLEFESILLLAMSFIQIFAAFLSPWYKAYAANVFASLAPAFQASSNGHKASVIFSPSSLNPVNFP